MGAPSPAASTLQTGAPGPSPAKQTCKVQSYKCITKGKKIRKVLLPRRRFTGNLQRHFFFQLWPQRTPPYPVLVLQEDGHKDVTQMSPDSRKHLAFISPTSTGQLLCPQDVFIKILFDLSDRFISIKVQCSEPIYSSWNPNRRCSRSGWLGEAWETRVLTLQPPSFPAGGNALTKTMVTQVTFCLKFRNNFPDTNWSFSSPYFHVPRFESEEGYEQRGPGPALTETPTPGCPGFHLKFHFFPPTKSWWEREKGRKEQFLFSICFHRDTEIKRERSLLTSHSPYTCQHSPRVSRPAHTWADKTHLRGNFTNLLTILTWDLSQTELHVAVI